MLCRKESDQYGRKMAALPRLREQDPIKTAAGHAAYQLPAVLPQVQAGGIGQCKGVYHDKNNRAGRKDAEPIIPEGDMALRFSLTGGKL